MPRHPGQLRLVLDTAVYVSAVVASRPGGHRRQLIDAATAGEITVIVSPLLLAEMRGVLLRDKFRRWLPVDQVDPFVESVASIADLWDDGVITGIEDICRDPADRYLIALARDSEAHYLVSTDQDLTHMRHPQVLIRTPTEIMRMLHEPAELGAGAVSDDRADDAWRRAEAEGHTAVLGAAAAFLVAVEADDAVDLLPVLVTPESLTSWLQQLPEVRAQLADKGLGTRADYPAADVAYVKVVAAATTQMITAHLLLPDALIMTLQRRPELPDRIGVGGWRIHSIGDYCPIDQLPPRRR